MIRDLHHVGIVCRSLEQALALYEDALALPLLKEGAVPSRGVPAAAILGAGGSCLELLQPGDDASPFAQHLADHGEGLHHLALWSDDIDADVDHLRELAVPLLDHEPRSGFTGRLSYLAPAAFDGAQLELVQPGDAPAALTAGESPVKRIDHVVLRVPDVQALCHGFDTAFGVATKRTFERGAMRFAFMRPGDVIVEVTGPKDAPGDPGTGRIVGLAFEVTGIDALVDSLRAKGYPVGDAHAALQGGRIASVHHSGACGVPLAFIDFTDASPLPARPET